MDMNKAFNFIEVEFEYNGDLGRLQQKTVDNKDMARKLLRNDVISKKEFDAVIEKIRIYFVSELEKVLKNPCFYMEY